MDGQGGYVAALLLGVAVATLVAWIFGREASQMSEDPEHVDKPVANILNLLYLVTALGFVFITSALGVPGGDFVETLVTKLGFELLILAAVGWFALQTLRDQSVASVQANRDAERDRLAREKAEATEGVETPGEPDVAEPVAHP